MLIVDARWPKTPAVGARDVAEVRIAAHGEPLTRFLDIENGGQRDHFRASAVSLAFWLADNWWRLRYECLDGSTPSVNWRLRHELSSASGGTFWPPLMIHSSGENVQFTPAFSRHLETSPLRYLAPDTTSVSGRAFEDGIDRFFDQVLDTCASALDGTAITELIATLRDERADKALASWRRVEARLGYDPDTVPEPIMRALGRLERRVGSSAIEEAASATPGSRSAVALENALSAAEASEVMVDLSAAHGLMSPANDTHPLAPWEMGRRAAQYLRRQRDFGLGPIRLKAFSELLGATKETLARPATARKLPYSARVEKKANQQKIALGSVVSRDRRFELSCALGDEIWSNSKFGIISKAKTDRQKFQRAFAQNLLAPFDGIRQHLDIDNLDDLAIDGVAKTFHVHPNVIKRVLILERVLPRQTLDERIEAA
ncbi:hypothetical protein [Sphingobium sp.]|uniref:hypothetical protein n=1 Tax=Sphingobium sp. TaxID=1912891 RepID=UPI0025E965CF|nr:hypothetical protein [Sphingobium sp.]